jgi:hypothetical protein
LILNHVTTALSKKKKRNEMKEEILGIRWMNYSKEKILGKTQWCFWMSKSTRSLFTQRDREVAVTTCLQEAEGVISKTHMPLEWARHTRHLPHALWWTK